MHTGPAYNGKQNPGRTSPDERQKRERTKEGLAMKQRIMEKREFFRRKLLRHPLLNSAVVRKAVLYGAYFAVGFVCSRGIVFGRYAPFGVAAAAAGPYSAMIAAMAGAVTGYLVPSAIHFPARYLAAVLAVGAIRWTLSRMGDLRLNPWFAPVISFLPLLATGIAVAAMDGSALHTWILYAAESLLGGCGAYFFSRASVLAMGQKGTGSLNHAELACVILTMGILVLSLSTITIGVISIGRVAAILLILFSCRYGGVVGGSIAGIVAGAMFGLATSGINGVSGALAFAGLMAGIFSPLGRVATALVFIVANGVGSLQVGGGQAVLTGLYEVMAATVIFAVWPGRTGSAFAAIFRQPAQLAHSDGIRRSVMMKLGFAASALESVSESVEQVSRRLERASAPTVEGVYQQAVDEVCQGCGLRGYCWGNSPHKEMDQLGGLTEPLRQKGMVERGDFPPEFQEHCSRLGEMASSVNQHYQDFLHKESAQRRVSQVRGVVMEQFSTTGQMLRDMAKELELCEEFDFGMAAKINKALYEFSVHPTDVSCRIDRHNRMVVEIEAPAAEKSRLSRSHIARTVAKVTGRHFEKPCVSVAGRICRFQISERPIYRASFGVSQHTCAGGTLCGDSYECFQDGTGRQIAMISDGMGTGGRAAVDGAMAAGLMATLVKAGVGFACALKITNSALMVKSGEETLSTLDVASIDLFSGKVELRKAGAPVSFLRRKGEVERLDAVSLPVGILEEAVFSQVDSSMQDGDLLVMFSDGAIATGETWVSGILQKWKEGEPKELAELLVQKAMEQREDGHDDDITVLVIKLSKYAPAA